jgi:hypothetical protein
VLTGTKLAEAGGIEEPSSSHGVQLKHEEDEGQTAEDERKYHEDLHRLQPACGKEEIPMRHNLGAVAHACNPGYSGSKDGEDCGLRPALA